MQLRQTTFTIRGLTPLIMHSGRLADPLDPAAKVLKAAVKKNKGAGKTDENEANVRKLEWFGGLYVDGDGAPCLPGEVLEGMLMEGSKKLRMGPKGKTLIVEHDAPLKYKGPKTAEELWATGKFRKSAGVRVKQSRVIRTRPMFPEWECTFTITWDPEAITDEDELRDIVDACSINGIGDWRPRFGRFEVVD